MRSTTLALLAGVVEAGPSSGVKKVITLLTELNQKVAKETAEAEHEQEEYSDWCIKVTTELESSIKYGTEKADELKAHEESSAADAQAHSEEVAELQPQVVKLEEDLDHANAVRKEEHKVFLEEEKELVEADAMLKKAYAVLKKSLSFVQGGKVTHDEYTEAVMGALGQIIAAASNNVESSKRIQALLQTDNSMQFTAPVQATVHAYESKSGSILRIIEDMQEENEDAISKLREAEMKKRHGHEMVAQDHKNQIAQKTQMVADAKENQAKFEAASKAAAADFANVSDSLADDKADLAKKSMGCRKAASEFEARKADATEEMAAIAKAVEILQGKFGSLFVQLKMRTGDFENRERASALLRRMGRAFNSFSMIQAASSAESDPFEKVRGMIKDMISKLEEQAAKEAGKEAKCKADIAKGTKAHQKKQADVEKLTSRSDSATARYGKLGEDVSDLTAQLKEAAAAFKESTTMRNKQREENNATIKDSAESVEAINSAIEVLQEFYGKAATSFLQEGRKSDTGNTIISVLQTSQEDFEKIRQDTEALEKDLDGKYEEEKQAFEIQKVKKSTMIDGKTKERQAIKVQLNQLGEDITEAVKALDAATEYLSTRKEECTSKAASYEERKKKREDEIAGLKEALQILSGEAAESFLETGFMARKA